MNSLQRYLGPLLRHRRFIFWEVLIVTVVVMAYSLIAAPVFTSVAQILPPSNDDQSLTSLSSMLGTGGLGSVIRLGSSLRGTQSSDLIAAILGSRTIRERVVDSCEFAKVYGLKKSREEAMRRLGEFTRIHVTDEGIVVIAVKGKTAAYAARLATCYVDELDRFLRESNMSRGRSMRIFVGKRLADAGIELNAAKDSLTSFQELHQVTAVDEETKAAVESYARMQADKIKSDIDLEFARALGGTDNPYVDNLRQQNLEFARRLSKFELGSSGPAGFGIGSGVPLKGVPEVAAEYMRRLGDYKLKEELYGMLVAQYEQARIAEIRDTPAITVLDPPQTPERRSAPQRAKMTLSAFALSLLVGVAASFLLEFWERQKSNPQVWQEWRRIARTLSDDLAPKRRNTGGPGRS